MSAQLTKLAKKRGRLPALVAAFALAALFSLQLFLSAVVLWLRRHGYPAYADESQVVDVLPLTFEMQPTTEQLLFFILPFALGTFLSLWLVAPISHELSLRFVLTRAALASAAGTLLAIVFTTVQGLVDSVGAPSYRYWEGESAAPGSVNFVVFGQNTLDGLVSCAGYFIFSTPAVLLAGVLLWLWLREHPREYAVAGLIDEL